MKRHVNRGQARVNDPTATSCTMITENQQSTNND